MMGTRKQQATYDKLDTQTRWRTAARVQISQAPPRSQLQCSWPTVYNNIWWHSVTPLVFGCGNFCRCVDECVWTTSETLWYCHSCSSRGREKKDNLIIGQIAAGYGKGLDGLEYTAVRLPCWWLSVRYDITFALDYGSSRELRIV